jgi:hypothetical protein
MVFFTVAPIFVVSIGTLPGATPAVDAGSAPAEAEI